MSRMNDFDAVLHFQEWGKWPEGHPSPHIL